MCAALSRITLGEDAIEEGLRGSKTPASHQRPGIPTSRPKHRAITSYYTVTNLWFFYFCIERGVCSDLGQAVFSSVNLKHFRQGAGGTSPSQTVQSLQAFALIVIQYINNPKTPTPPFVLALLRMAKIDGAYLTSGN